MSRTFRAVRVGPSGNLTLVERVATDPGRGDVLIAVEACGICGADAADIRRAAAAEGGGHVPGHEAVGRIVATGEGVPARWKIGQRVGVGRLGGQCNECDPCRQGQFQHCRDQPVTGATRDGGFAEVMVARASGLVSIPDELNAAEAAPILCAGIATFNALKRSGAGAGDLVVVHGIGGLGHLALQYARRMGFRVVAVGRGDDIAADARDLGAHIYIDAAAEDAMRAIQELGGARAIVTTVPDAEAVSSLARALTPQAQLILLGAGSDPMHVSPRHLVAREQGVRGSMTGTPYEIERAMDFSVLTAVRPRVETMPLERVDEAYRHMRSGRAKFRVVLTMPGRDLTL